jgi:hypothetical protein
MQRLARMDDVTIEAPKREQAVSPPKRRPAVWIVVISALALLAGIVTAFYWT